MKTLKIIGIIAVIAVIIGVVAGYFIYNKPHKNYEKAKADFTLTANELFNEFEENSDQANQKYDKKVIELTGGVDEINKLQNNSSALIMMGGGINAELQSIYSTDDKYKKKLAELKSEDQVTVKCRYVGFEDLISTEVKLDNCYIVKK